MKANLKNFSKEANFEETTVKNFVSSKSYLFYDGEIRVDNFSKLRIYEILQGINADDIILNGQYINEKMLANYLMAHMDDKCEIISDEAYSCGNMLGQFYIIYINNDIIRLNFY